MGRRQVTRGVTGSGIGRVMRFCGFVAAASVVVAVLLVVSLWAFGMLDRPAGHHAVDLRLLTQGERRDLAESLGEASRPERPSLPPLEDIPPLELPVRQESGFVQVEYVVDPTGRVVEAEVVRSIPPGVFEEQALAIVRAREFSPDQAGRRTEVVDFTLEPGDR